MVERQESGRTILRRITPPLDFPFRSKIDGHKPEIQELCLHNRLWAC